MKFTRTILFLLMFVFVSACNSTTPTPIISSTNTPLPIVEVTSTSPVPTETATKVAPTAVATALAGAEVTMPDELRIQPSVDAAETAAFPYCGQTFQLELPSAPGADTIMSNTMTEFQNSDVGIPIMEQVGKTLSGMQGDLVDPALLNLKVLPAKGNFCSFVWAIRKGVSPVGNDWMNGALYGFFKDKSGAWVKITIKK